MDRQAALLLLESQHRFPSDHRFHVIVRTDGGGADAVSAAIARHFGLGTLGAREERVPSRNGTYVSLRLSLPCANAEAVLDAYALLAQLPGVVRYF
jgi:putative lipoic acid-binding regulatory protein